MLESRLYQAALVAAQGLHARKLWRVVGGDESIALAVPGEDSPMFVNVMGQEAKEFGLLFFRGPNAYDDVMDMLTGDVRDMDSADGSTFLGFFMCSYAEMAPWGRRFLAKARFRGRGSDTAPCFIAKDGGREPRAVTREETEKLLYALQALLGACESGPPPFASLLAHQAIPTLVIGGDLLAPTVSSEIRAYGGGPRELGALDSSVPDDLFALPRLPRVWLVGFPILPIAIAGDDRTTRLALIVDGESEHIILARPVQGGVAEAVPLVYNAFRGENTLGIRGVPEHTVVVNRDLFNALWAAMDRLGVDCAYEPDAPLLGDVLGDVEEEIENSLDDVDTGDRPAAEPMETTAEIAAHVQALFRQHYMAWLDTPIPALGDKTPRKACRTEAGKQRVARLIRAIPAPFGPHKVEIPRAEMFRELGIEAPEEG